MSTQLAFPFCYDANNPINYVITTSATGTASFDPYINEVLRGIIESELEKQLHNKLTCAPYGDGWLIEYQGHQRVAKGDEDLCTEIMAALLAVKLKLVDVKSK